jgi:hypothetical protein
LKLPHVLLFARLGTLRRLGAIVLLVLAVYPLAAPCSAAWLADPFVATAEETLEAAADEEAVAAAGAPLQIDLADRGLRRPSSPAVQASVLTLHLSIRLRI